MSGFSQRALKLILYQRKSVQLAYTLSKKFEQTQNSKYVSYLQMSFSSFFFKVYAYLRRLGYAVTRNKAPNEDYPLPPPFDLEKRTPKPPLLMRLLSPFIFLYSKFLQVFTPNFNWWNSFKQVDTPQSWFVFTDIRAQWHTHRHCLLSSAWVY